MPLVGFGIWKVPAENAADSVYNAIKIGYVRSKYVPCLCTGATPIGLYKMVLT